MTTSPISEKRRLLLEKLLQKEGIAASSRRIPRRIENGPAPLSFTQQRLWFLQRLDPESASYNLPKSLRLTGALAIEALGRSLEEILRRHESLRTVFAEVSGEPVQVVLPPPPGLLPLTDLSGLRTEEREEELARHLEREGARPFDLARGPIVRFLLFRLHEHEHVLAIVAHHVAADAWSVDIFLRELTALYGSALRGEASPLPALPVQYADFAVWQRQWLTGRVLEDLLGTWLARLADVPTALELQTDRPRSPVRTSRGGVIAFDLGGRELRTAIHGLAHEGKATLFIALLTAFQALLHRWSGQDDFVVGSPVAGRNREELEPLIGAFINTLALRADLKGEPDFRESLARTREVVMEAHASQDLPFERLVHELALERDLSHAPLFQALFSLHQVSTARLALSGLSLRDVTMDSGGAQVDLILRLNDTGTGLQGTLRFSRDLFDGPTVQRMAGHYRALLQRIVEAPWMPLSALPVLSEPELHQVLEEWSGASATGRRQACLHEIFAQWVERTPEAGALTFESEELRYGELDRRANRVAHRLLALGIRRGSRVGLCVERSLNLVIGILGILKAGAAYVPLDPSYPKERLAFLIEDSGAEALVTEERLLPDLPQASGKGDRVLCLDSDPEETGEPGFEPPVTGVTAEDVAYVIYTSGSTGRPKGVVVPHANVVALFSATADRFGFGPHDVWTLFHSYAFDFSVWELWGALLHGGRLIVTPYWVTRSPQAFYELLDRERVTVLNQTPSAFRQLAWAEEEAGAAGRRDLALRWVIFGGEALEMGSLRSWFERHGEERPRLVNMYGITETTVHVTFRELGLKDVEAGSVLGRPIPGWKVFLLDSAFSPVAPGRTGEIHVGGEGMALGYLGRVELTATRFIPDPLSGEPGSRLYRSGDLARFRPDGDLEYLGRIDDQVKIRGFRIEPGEIEAVLASHPAVREVAVVLRNDHGDRRLVAYVAAAEPRPAPGELRELVRQRQPEHMVPAAFVLLDHLPLTPHGKVDRQALPAPDRDLETAAFTAPRNPLEESLARIWADLLGVPRVGTESNFFDLGGDSIQAVRLVSRMNEELCLNFKVQDLFRHQTVAALAAQSGRIAGRTSVEQERAAGLARIESLCQAILDDRQQRASLPADYEDFYPLSGIEKGMAYYSLLLPEEPVYHDQFVYLLSIADIEGFFEALALTMERHPIFRTGYHFYSFAEPIKVVHRELRLGREVENLSNRTEPEKRRRIEEYRASDFDNRFTFEGEVLWRLKLFRLEGDLHCAILSFHHSMLDGWSCASFWVEVNNLYVRSERREALPPLASSYKDFLAITLGRESSEETLSFWRETLGGAGRNKLPFNRVKVRGTQARGMRTLHRRLGGKPLTALRSAALAHHVPLRTLALAAHVWLLHVIAAEDDVVTGIVSHERPEIKDGDKILGCFLNTIPVRIPVRTAGFGPLLRAVDDYLRKAKEHEILLADIAAAVGNRETADNPFFDTIFNFLDFHILEEAEPQALSQTSLSERTVERYDLESKEMTNTLFDLEFLATLGELGIKLKYSPRYFDDSDAWRAIDLYVRILERLVSDSELRLDPELLLSPAERSEIVDRFNDTRTGYPRETPVFRWVEARAEELPDHAAVSCAGEILSYRELNRAANQLARHLLRQGARPGDNIGVIYPRSVDLVVALTAVLKMGGAYVPVEPGYPPARKGYIARNSGVTRILADQPYELSGIPEEAVAFVIPSSAELREADSDLDIAPRPDQLAYTIYTSGSTGNPKGVMIAHHSVVNLVQWVNREFAIGPKDSVLMLSSVCFDLSVYDLFGGLSAGARVVIARAEDLQDPARLKRLLAEERITFWSSVPSTMGLLVNFLEDVDPGYRHKDLTVVFLSGDWIPLALPEKIRKFFPNARVISLGGATEGTVWSIFHPVDRVDEAWTSIPYGRPIDNNTFYILDQGLSVVPPGVVGDLYLGGVGVAQGYALDPEKTAGAFLPDRFTAEGGVRMYRTGDLGRMLPDGNIEFLGRADHQVKIRGFRVELGEVESQLLRHPLIRDAVVIDRIDGSGEKYLCAYVVAEELPSTPELKAYLATTLPDYMIPAAFVPLSVLPLTGNGKLDRRALPDPEVASLSTSARFVAPASELEAALVGIWEEVLKIEGIGTSHNFFELGGHSLLAVQVITRIRRQLDVELPLRVLFDTPTVADLAAEVELRRGPGNAPVLSIASYRQDRTSPPPLSFGQERFWKGRQREALSVPSTIPILVAFEGLDLVCLQRALQEIVDRHEVLRTTFREEPTGPVQVIHPELPARLPLVDLERIAPRDQQAEIRRWSIQDGRSPFDYEHGPLFRTTVFQRSERQSVVLFTVHHVAFDGWSETLLTQELSVLYNAFREGRPSPLQPLAAQYQDFARWQRRTFAEEALSRQVAFWREHLQGAVPVDLLGDRPEPVRKTFAAGSEGLLIPEELEKKLDAFSAEHGVTLFMTLLAAFKALLRSETGQDDLVVTCLFANRDQAEIENLIGYFSTGLPLRTSGSRTFRELLEQVRTVTLLAHEHPYILYEPVLEGASFLKPGESGGITTFRVMFQLAKMPRAEESLSDVKVARLSLDTGRIGQDLTLFLAQSDRLAGRFRYNRDVLDEERIARLRDRFLRILADAVEDPENPLPL